MRRIALEVPRRIFMATYFRRTPGPLPLVQNSQELIGDFSRETSDNFLDFLEVHSEPLWMISDIIVVMALLNYSPMGSRDLPCPLRTHSKMFDGV